MRCLIAMADRIKSSRIRGSQTWVVSKHGRLASDLVLEKTNKQNGDNNGRSHENNNENSPTHAEKNIMPNYSMKPSKRVGE